MKRRFAFNLKLKHPAYILDEKNNNYFFLSITHAPYSYKKKNIALSSVDKTGRSLYIIPIVLIADKREFSKRDFDLKFSYRDGAIIRDIDKLVKLSYNK